MCVCVWSCWNAIYEMLFSGITAKKLYLAAGSPTLRTSGFSFLSPIPWFNHCFFFQQSVVMKPAIDRSLLDKNHIYIYIFDFLVALPMKEAN